MSTQSDSSDPRSKIVTCDVCKTDYDPTNANNAKHHQEPVDCGCGRCTGKPHCYFCGSSFCFCMQH